MDIQRLAAIVLIASFVAVLLGSFPTSIPGYYQTQDIAERLRLVEEFSGRWFMNKLLFYVWSVLALAGMVLLTIYLRRSGASIVAFVGLLPFALGTAAYFLTNYIQQTDLAGYFAGNYLDYHRIGNWLSLAGLLLLGVAILQAGLPAWLSYLTIGTSLVLAVVLLVVPAIFWLIPFGEIVLLPVIGIGLLRQ